MRGRMIAHGGFANRGVDNGVHFLANANCLLGCDLMGAHTLYRVVASGYFGDDCVVIVGVEPSAVADLPAGFGVEGGALEDNFAGVAGLEFLNAGSATNYRRYFAFGRSRLRVADKL